MNIYFIFISIFLLYFSISFFYQCIFIDVLLDLVLYLNKKYLIEIFISINIKYIFNIRI